MLIFQINPSQLEEGQKIDGKDWAFWNAYLSARVKEKDYALLPSYIDYITDTEIKDNVIQDETYLVELDNGDDDDNRYIDN